MYNYYREPWLVDRYAATLAEVFGAAAVREHGTGHRACRCSSSAPTRRRSTARPARRSTRAAVAPDPATDDHPFPYLRTPSIPGFYLRRHRLHRSGSRSSSCAPPADHCETMTPYLDLICMGAAFLLLETKNVVQFALLFGTTWLVNAFVFGGVLLSVLLAVAVSKRVRIRRTGAALRRPARRPCRQLAGARSGVARSAARSRASSSPSPSPSRRSSSPTSCSPSGSATPPTATAAFGANLLGAMLGGLARVPLADRRLPPPARSSSPPSTPPPSLYDPIARRTADSAFRSTANGA